MFLFHLSRADLFIYFTTGAGILHPGLEGRIIQTCRLGICLWHIIDDKAFILLEKEKDYPPSAGGACSITCIITWIRTVLHLA